MTEGYTTISIKKEIGKKAEHIRKEKGLRSLSQVVTKLIEKEHQEVIDDD